MGIFEEPVELYWGNGGWNPTVWCLIQNRAIFSSAPREVFPVNEPKEGLFQNKSRASICDDIFWHISKHFTYNFTSKT